MPINKNGIPVGMEPKKFKRDSTSRTNRRLGLYMSDEEFEEIKQLAAAEGTSMNKYILDAVWTKRARSLPAINPERLENMLRKKGYSFDKLAEKGMITQKDRDNLLARTGWIAEQTLKMIYEIVSDDIHNSLIYVNGFLPLRDARESVSDTPTRGYVVSITFEADYDTYNKLLPYMLDLVDLSKNYIEMRANLDDNNGVCTIEYDVLRRNQTVNQLIKRAADILMNDGIYAYTARISDSPS